MSKKLKFSKSPDFRLQDEYGQIDKREPLKIKLPHTEKEILTIAKNSKNYLRKIKSNKST